MLYGSTKAALEYLTRAWAYELAPDGIRVNGQQRLVRQASQRVLQRAPSQLSTRPCQLSEVAYLPPGASSVIVIVGG